MPSYYKIHYLKRKIILKKALATLLPSEIIHRPKKGFSVPVAAWLRGPLQKFTTETLLSRQARSRNIFDAAVVQHLFEEHQRSRVNRAPELWALLTLELWFQEYFD